MAVKCGSCRDRHETVAEVRDCYALAQHEEEQAKAEAAAEQRAEQWFEERGGAEDDPIERQKWAEEDMALETLNRMTGGAPDHQGPSPKQVRYALDLLDEREWPDTLTEDDILAMERGQVSKLIDGLKTARVKGRGSRAESPIPDVPAGRYAIYKPGDDYVSYSYVDRQDLVPFKKGSWSFYQVDVPTEGRWRGYTFLKRLIGSPGEYRKEPIRGMPAARILQQIQADPEKAALDYGQQSGVCGVCSSPLTNEDSLKRGIGPVCANKTGWGAA